MSDYDFLLELRLKKLDENLTQRHASCMSLFEQMLKKFLAVFPTFTDHTLLHTLTVINISNQLLRNETEKLNAEEIYIYLMAAALHDIGMGVSDKDLDLFIDAIGIRDYVNDNPELSKPTLIRKFHNDFSAEFVKKYQEILEIPNERYAHAIAEVSRGHRKVDLMNEEQYPTHYDLGDGKSANLAMLAALIRITDELDCASDRNPELLYKMESIEAENETSMFEFSKHKAIQPVEFTQDSIVIVAETDRDDLAKGIREAAQTIKDKLDYCIFVMNNRSDIRIDCTKIQLLLNNKEILLK